MLHRLRVATRRTVLLRRASTRPWNPAATAAAAAVRRLTTARVARTTAATSTNDTEPALDLAVYVSGSTDPFFNLGTEQFLFDNGGRLPSDAYRATGAHAGTGAAAPRHTLFLWRNAPSVIIGAHQNPWKECFVERLAQDQVHLVRRRSGGGAVYQDLGNSIFTFMTSPKAAFDKERNTGIVLKALRDGFGVADAHASGRNDITVGGRGDLTGANSGRKISGSAFKHSNTTSLHHGTLLLDVGLTQLARYLNPSKAKLQSKGVTSVVARVMNLKERVPTIDHASWNEAVRRAFLATYGVTDPVAQTRLAAGVPVLLTPDTPELKASPAHAACVRALQDWDWRFGKTPDFSHHLETRFAWGTMDVHVDVYKGMVRAVKLYSDALVSSLVDVLQARLVGVSYSADGVRRAATQARADLVASQAPDVALAACDEFAAWMVAQIH